MKLKSGSIYIYYDSPPLNQISTSHSLARKNIYVFAKYTNNNNFALVYNIYKGRFEQFDVSIFKYYFVEAL